MNWLAKALAFKALSTVPGGKALYRHAQVHWTKSIVATPERVKQKMDIGMTYLSKLKDHGYETEAIRNLRHMDLGCGWHPSIPLMYFRMGMHRQVLTDVCPLMSNVTFRGSLEQVDQLLANENHPGHALLDEGAKQPPPASASLDELLAFGRMEYHAPYFEWANGQAGSLDLATCTQVLMHVERPILDQCFKMVYDLLRPGGLFMTVVHLFDIYSNSDPGITIYNHLKYSKRMWSTLVNSDLMTFSRLKARDYREALEVAGFEILEFTIDPGGPEDLESLRSLTVHPEFTARYSEEELAQKHLFFVARRP